MAEGRNDLRSFGEAGPSGISSEEISALLGEDTDPFGYLRHSEDENDNLLDLTERTERQQAFQLQVSNGVSLDEPGRFHFELRPLQQLRSERMGVRETRCRATLQQTGNFVPHQNVAKALTDALCDALTRVARSLPDADDDDRLYFSMASDRLNHTYQQWGMTVGEWRHESSQRIDTVLKDLSKMLNSNEQFEFNDSFQVSFTHVLGNPQGGGHKRKSKPGHTDIDVFKKMKRDVFQIPQTEDNLCCAKAIVTAKAWVDQHPKWRSFKDGRKIQNIEAQKLHVEVSLEIGKKCGSEELTLFASAPSLYDYQLVLINAERKFEVTVFGPYRSDKQLILLYDRGHYDAVRSLPGFFGTTSVCHHCYKPYNDEGQHRCTVNKLHCKGCLQDGCPDYVRAQHHYESSSVPCRSCHRTFYGETCLANHLSRTHQGKPCNSAHPSVCQQRRKCEQCLKLLKGQKEQQQHQCGYYNCPCCHKYEEMSSHKCFVQVAKSPEELRAEKTKQKRPRRSASTGLALLRANEDDTNNDGKSHENKNEKPPLLVFFDIEAMQEREQHVANLVVGETENDDRPVVFRGDSCIRDFLQWLDTLTENDTRNVTVIAHNFQGYDGYFVARGYRDRRELIEQVRNGAKLLQLTHGRIRFIDSLSFFQMPLSAFPKTFGLKEMKKGYFPHLFNTPEHQDYCGELPTKDYYMPETMSEEGRRAFEQWHDEQLTRHVKFDFTEELKAYCESDVKLLKEGCLSFRHLFETHARFNPFDQITIASACNLDLRMNRMKINTIASEPLHGWRRQVNQSHAAYEWLYWKDAQLRQRDYNAMSAEDRKHCDHMADAYDNYRHPLLEPRIRHGKNFGEHRVEGTNVTLDGYDQVVHKAYEFHGCFWHGCPRCYPLRHEPHARLLNRTMEDVYRLTQRRIQLLRNHGYDVEEIWECEWNAFKHDDPQIQQFLTNHSLSSPLNPRDAFYGGRTNAIKLYHKVDEAQGDKVRYFDFTSLYPWVNKYSRYPVGHPEFYNGVDPSKLSDCFGLAKCRVLPPRQLYHPVLPYRQGQKLTFPLCAACVSEQIKKPLHDKTTYCSHSDEQRILHGTWCTPELEQAVKKGYIILSIEELWHFPESKVGLFKDYVDTWLKIKEEASWRRTEEEKADYIERYYTKEGIRLDPEKMVYNPGLRQLAKMMLNSMWGKFGQNTNKSQVAEFVDHSKFQKFLNSDKYDIRYVSPVTEEIVEVHYKYQEEDVIVSPNLNIFVACFTTCWARLHLYEALDLLGERVLYFDTDSVVFISHPGDTEPVVGEFLGEFKDELDQDDYIVEFISAGPKNYGYLTKRGSVCCKVRGFSLNSEGKTQLNYYIMRQNVLDEVGYPQDGPRLIPVVKTYQIQRDSQNYCLYTHPQYKLYQMVYTKRVLDPVTFQTYPYGYFMSTP